jgi:3-hydroxymyristoyl/3-hydroxydecanoyl-(acyl carrier protein) dehydratase
MLVDRIITVEGEKLSLDSGRVVTEHDVLTDAWYLDGGRAPVCISVEAGQADLFLCAYLGIDHRVKGQRTYRLLDAKIRFHSGLPEAGDTIRYDIRIDKFVRQDDTWLFFFRFEGYIGDTHLITMTDGCAGFFTEEEVRNSGGIILTQDDMTQEATINGTPFTPLVSQTRAAYGDEQVDALRRGDAGGCFGAAFEGIQLPDALCLPDGRMRLIHRIVSLEPDGGRYGKGFVKAEADIHPDDWFLTCHFVDDMVMPGTLMYECCAHTLRVLLMRLGWVTDRTGIAYEPVQGLDCRLKCRGPVTPSTRHVHYCVEIKEIGYHPEPYVIADAHMYADEDYIVFFKEMSMQMTGVTELDIRRFWQARSAPSAAPASPPTASPGDPLYTRDHILEFAVGSPSKAFGQPYAVFDSERTIARLPGPPYCFMDRITTVEPEPWTLQPDGWVEAQYDIPADAWYFTADASGVMPFCVLLEIALQPCGWLAAYAGSALKSENDLKFRNLGGKAELRSNLPPQSRTLTMRTRITKVSEAADMIIEHFEFDVLAGGRSVYGGTTYFGFFTHQALSQQVGLREPVYMPDEEQLKDPYEITLDMNAPLTPEAVSAGTVFQPAGLSLPGKALCMIDGIEAGTSDGGPHGLGFIRGYKVVDPQEWFFKAHFYQDPVCPGSLGIESFLQLIKFAALERWPHLKSTHRFEMAAPHGHQWSYRGQVIPTNQKVTVEAVITSVTDGDTPTIMADGCLQVDGIYIYKMEGFGLRLIPL